MGLLPPTPIYAILFLTLPKPKHKHDGKNDQRIRWQREVRFEGRYDEAREKGRQEGGEDGEEGCFSEDEEEVIFLKESQVFYDLGLFL